MIEWKPEDFEEGATIFLAHWHRCQSQGRVTKEDLMLMLADVANAMELAEERRRDREREKASKVASASSGKTITIPVGTTASTW